MTFHVNCLLANESHEMPSPFFSLHFRENKD